MLSQFPALDANWRQTLRAQTRSVVFCWAVWSVVHKYYAPVLARVAPDYNGQIAFFTADVDAEYLADFCQETAIVTIPTLLMWQADTKTDSIIGYTKEETLRAQFYAWLQE